MKRFLQSYLEFDTMRNRVDTLEKDRDALQEGQESLRSDVDNLGKATDLIIRNEEKKERTKRARKLEQDFDRKAKVDKTSRPALKALKGGRS